MKTIIVAGITRSGLTLTMQMLMAGGYPCVGTYPAFEDNHNMAKPGLACKLVDTHECFPPTGEYYVIRLNRDRVQQTKSIVKLLRQVAGIPVQKHEIPAMQKSLGADYNKIDAWGKRQAGFMELQFENIINQPQRAAQAIAAFVDYPMDIAAMVKVVVRRGTNCLNGMLETTMI